MHCEHGVISETESAWVSVGQGQGQGQLVGEARLTALTPDSCWPMFMMMMETSCQRRERWDSRLSTDRWPSALSDWSSRRISDSSASTSSHPRRRCSAEGDQTYRKSQYSVYIASFYLLACSFFLFSYLSLLSSHLLSGWAYTWGSLGRRAAAGARWGQEYQSNPA